MFFNLNQYPVGKDRFYKNGSPAIYWSMKEETRILDRNFRDKTVFYIFKVEYGKLAIIRDFLNQKKC